MLLTKNEITILHVCSGECRNTYFEIKRSGGSGEQKKQKFQVLRFITSIHSVRDLARFSKLIADCSQLQNLLRVIEVRRRKPKTDRYLE